MDFVIHLIRNAIPMAGLSQPPMAVTIAVIAAITGWSSLLVHKSIANFHDGLRPLIPEFLAGRMTRRDLASRAFTLSAAFVIGFGLPFTLASGLILVYMLLLPADVIGTASPKSWISFILGCLWGTVIVVLVKGVFLVASLVPVNFLTPLHALINPVISSLMAIPVLAIALQFGPGKGVLALTLSVSSFFVFKLVLANGFVEPESAGIITGMACLIAFAYLRDLQERQKNPPVEMHAEGPSEYVDKAAQVRSHLPWLMVQGALLALACRLWIFSGSEVDFAPIVQ